MMWQNEESSKWFANFENSYAIHNALSWRKELSFFLLLWDSDAKLEWMELNDSHDQIKPFHFETYFGKEPVRDTYYIDTLKEIRSDQDVIIKELFGFSDLFLSLFPRGDKKAFLHVGQFLAQQPTWETLSSSWKALTGQEPASANPDFLHFVKMVLGLPVLEPELLEAVKQFVKLYADFIAGGNDVKDKVNNINREKFAKLWPINEWVDSVISSNKFLRPPWYYESALSDWIKEGMGISSLPTTAMALMPLESQSDALDPVQTLIRNAQIQRECIKLSRELSETAATKLQDYGVSIITLCKDGKSAARARLELREVAQKFRNFISDKFGVNSVVGIGRTLSKGAPLYESHKDAILSLHMCVQLEKDILFFDEHGGGELFRYAQLQNSADKLMEAIDRERSTELKLASDRYVQFVLRYANHRIEVVRGQFLATLFQLFAKVQRRNPMRTEARNSFINELAEKLEESRSLNQVIDSFNEAVQRLSFVSSKAWRGPSVMLLEATLQYLRENFFEQLPLPDVARKAGFSVPVFTRVFKQATGTSYLSYVRTIRITHAKKLLSTTMLTLEQIAQSCGFHSQHHLIRSFKKVTNKTPGAYRKRN